MTNEQLIEIAREVAKIEAMNASLDSSDLIDDLLIRRNNFRLDQLRTAVACALNRARARLIHLRGAPRPPKTNRRIKSWIK